MALIDKDLKLQNIDDFNQNQVLVGNMGMNFMWSNF